MVSQAKECVKKRTRFLATARQGKVLLVLSPDFAETVRVALQDAMARKNYGNVALEALRLALDTEAGKAIDQLNVMAGHEN